MSEDNDRIIEVCRQQLAQGDSIEKVLLDLRDGGYSKASSIIILQAVLDTTSLAATRIVHNSETWAHRKKFDEQVEDVVFDVLEDIGKNGLDF